MNESDVINFSALERELQSALEADKKYQRENDAKFRALHQHVASYEEFRDIVLASHLKPLDRKDKTGAPRKQPWNTIASAKKEQDQASCEVCQPQLSEFQPRTASEFSRDWRRFSGSVAEKYGLLVTLGGEGLQGMFRAEVGFGLLGEFLLVLSQSLQPGDEAAVMGVLEGLSRTPRFGLSVSFLSRAEQEACRELFRRLWDAVGVKGHIREDLGVNPEEEYTQTGVTEVNKSPSPIQIIKASGSGISTEKLQALMQTYGVASP